MANSMIGGVSNNNVWYVDSRASNHMTGHGEWFRDAKNLKTLGFVETGDDTTHPITWGKEWTNVHLGCEHA
jgi:hypothetical protein